MDPRLIKPVRRSPLLLKDHLLDDLSSCSSNGFRSFPRRQCCTTVRFIHEVDRKNKKPAVSALQSFITAVKRLPFGVTRSPEKKKSSISSLLPRSFSKKLFRKGGFWKRKAELGRWKPLDQPLKEDPAPSGNDFTAAEGGNSSPEVSLKLPEVQNDVAEQTGVVVTNDVSVESTTTTTTNSSDETKKQWSSDQEKEQFSPVSVLDCPFDDDDDEVSSPFQHRLIRMEGTRKKLLKKIQRFECLAKLEPVNLTTRFASHLDSDNESSTSPLPHSEEDEEEEEAEDEEEKALELLDQIKSSMTGLKLKADNLMLDFFKEGITGDKQPEELLEIAGDWIGGRKSGNMFMEWKVEKNRQAYLEDMEKGGEWKRLGLENKEVVLELGNEMFDAMLNELLLDITC